MDKAPVSKTGDSRFEPWLPRFFATSANAPAQVRNPDLSKVTKGATLPVVGVELRCVDCGTNAVSALFWRGPGQHGCSECGGQLVLARESDERRGGMDRRKKRFFKRWPDWRNGTDRRGSVADAVSTRVAG